MISQANHNGETRREAVIGYNVRIFVTDDKIGDGFIRVDGSDALHLIRSLRVTRGERLIICDMSRREYICEAERITAETVTARIISSTESENEPPYHAVVYLALSKGERFELAAQKCVELGAAELVPFESEHTVLQTSDAYKKLPRWRKITAEAAKQCGRAIVPSVREPIRYGEAAAELAVSNGLRFICYEGDGTRALPELFYGQAVPDKIAFAVGPEGGFSARETGQAREMGIALCGLGKRILRCETAPLYVLSALSYEFELSRRDRAVPEGASANG